MATLVRSLSSNNSKQSSSNIFHRLFFKLLRMSKIMLHVSTGYRRLRMDYTLILKMKSKPLLVFILDPFMYD